MTRYTNFARKRTYVEAGFNNEPTTEREEQKMQPAGENERDTKKRKSSKVKETQIAQDGLGDGGEGQTKSAGDEVIEQNFKRSYESNSFKGKKRRTSDNGWPKGAFGTTVRWSLRD